MYMQCFGAMQLIIHVKKYNISCELVVLALVPLLGPIGGGLAAASPAGGAVVVAAGGAASSAARTTSLELVFLEENNNMLFRGVLVLEITLGLVQTQTQQMPYCRLTCSLSLNSEL
ncbi:unnamed protein product [Ilex paraguariensis]|uniref:Uncharacterized protein n=1 Tax=Ilex paraguariensis TaxID=185542 RepID=A0ABC8QLD1_9AQUA